MTRMKDSGNPWVREIPSDWFEKKLRYLVKLRGEKSVTTDYKKYVGLENIMSQTGQYVQTGIEVDLTENLTFEVGDILFGKLRPYLRKYWRAEFSGTASSEFVIIKGSSLNLNFLFWAIQSDSFINDVDSSTYGSKMPRASWEYMKNIKLPFPESIEEQTQIADFLDKKVAQLDKVKSLLEEQIKTLEDYRQSLIYETVTKGLDKTVPLKESGIDWIGQIPEGWEVGRLKDFVKFQTGTTPPQSVGVNQDESGIPWFKPGDFSDNSIDLLSSENHITHEVVMQYNLSVYPKKTILLVGIASIGKVGYSAQPSYSNQQITALRTIGEIFPRYLAYLMFSSGRFIKETALYTVVPIINNQYLATMRLVLPSENEQKIIVEYLDRKLEQINQMIAIKKEQIENINKQRQTLIYDYVTGKRRV